MCHVHSDRSFDAQVEGWELSFTGGKMRTAAQETPQLALRKIRYQFKEFSILCRERCKPLGSLTSFLSYASQLSGVKSCLLVHHKEWQMSASYIPPTPQQSPSGNGQHLLDHSFGSPHLHLEARNCWWLWLFLFIDMAGDIFISQSKYLFHWIETIDSYFLETTLCTDIFLISWDSCLFT